MPTITTAMELLDEGQCPEQGEEAIGPSGYARRYRVIAEGDGFRVLGRDRHPVYVRLEPAKGSLLVVGDPDDIGDYDEDVGTCDVHGSHYALYGYQQVLDAIARTAMSDWSRPDATRGAWSGALTWALSRTRRALHYSGVYQQWQRLIGLVPDERRLVAKAVFAATFDGRSVGCETWPALYEQRWLVEDILHYRAAAIACHYASTLVAAVGECVAGRREQYGDSFLAHAVGSRCEAYNARLSRLSRFPSDSLTYTRGKRELRQALLHLLAADWKALFSGDGQAGRSLRRTLMNLPGSLSGKLMCGLPRVDFLLTRPITDRLELLALLLFARFGSSPFSATQSAAQESAWEGPIYAHARRAELLSALRLLSGHLRRELRPRLDGVTELVCFVRDYCRYCDQEGIGAHRGNIVGLADKAVRWHRRVREESVRSSLEGLSPTTALALPPLPLPENPALRFLATVDDVFREGVTMEHCIASYARRALEGQCFLFHVDYKGFHATVEVWPDGSVSQSYGPRNAINAASAYGRRVLTRWGKALAQATAHAGGWQDQVGPVPFP